jgi:putative membrane protein
MLAPYHQGMPLPSRVPDDESDGSDEAPTAEQDADGQREPDYRFTLANERTFLAWIRTALALLAGAIAVVSLVPSFGYQGARTGIGVVLALLGIAVSAGSARHWQRNQKAMRRGADLPRSRMPAIVAGALAVLAVLIAILLLLRHNG